ncbi:MAG: rRNA pseudouridine synthase [Clostridia bacterium]|nr:rRNA pseudouridine synthase [Clostridia bacterium]
MRLDRLLSSTGRWSRKEASALIRRGEVTIDGKVEKDPAAKVDEVSQTAAVAGEPVIYRKFVYVMLNKPEGFVSSTDEPGERVVTELLSKDYERLSLFPCGRLDKNTTGLLILTNDGQTAHRLLSPKHHAEKTYRYTLKYPLGENERLELEAGVDLETGVHTLPCRIMPDSPTSGAITLTEGKFHQIKLMAKSVRNAITSLERVSFAGIGLDPALARGEYRELTNEEIRLLTGGDN